MNDTPIENGKQLPGPGRERHVRPAQWLFLVWPPVFTPLLATGWYMLAFVGLGGVGIILYLLTPLFCAVWSFCICRRLAGSSTLLLVFLFALQLVLIFVAFLLGTPHWD